MGANMHIVAVETQRRLLGALVLSLVYLCSVGAVAQQRRRGESGVSMISDPKTGTILINARLSENPIVMILDTGASHSIFDARAFGMSPVQLQVARMNGRGLGLNADVVWRTASFTIADQQWNQQSVEIAIYNWLMPSIESYVSQVMTSTLDGVEGAPYERPSACITVWPGQVKVTVDDNCE